VRVALIGTRGAPARYGGFETAVEEIGAGLVERGHDVTVYCRDENDAGTSYRGMRRVVLPAVRRKALETLSHSGLSALHAVWRRAHVAMVFNAANAPFLLLLRLAGLRTLLHIDGHDARRTKWRGLGQRYYSWATRLGLRLADVVVVDSQAMQDELHALYGVQAEYVAYGASTSAGGREEVTSRLRAIGLEPDGYHLVVARFEPENHVLEILQSYVAEDAELPLVLVGFEGFPSYYDAKIAAIQDPRIVRLGAVWDQELLDALYAGAATYVHGHSVGGTNPSLLRAMINGAPVIAFDCPYNRETTGGHALWFDNGRTTAGELMVKSERDDFRDDQAELARHRAKAHYTWPDVVGAYELLLKATTSP
jgi:glycosyltransferase involved in cell wall biosynthesis